MHIRALCKLLKLAPPPGHINSLEGPVITLVPIPPRLERLRRSGYSLPFELALSLKRLSAQRLQLEPRALIRARHSPSQASLSQAERARAQLNTLCGDRRLQGRQVCLIDDVSTTGATLKEARRACLEAGASSVEALSLFSAR